MKKILIIAVSILVLGYVIFQGRSVIFGPSILLETPADNAVIEDEVFVVKGRVNNATQLSINDHQVFTNPEGYFESKLIAHEGINIIKLTAKDRFGRVDEEIVRIVGN